MSTCSIYTFVSVRPLQNRPTMQMALIIETDCVRLYNILSQTWEPESLAVDTTGKQWTCTPCRTALLAVHHDGDLGGWLLNAYALEDGGHAQPLFWAIMEDAQLPHELASLPSNVRLGLGVHKQRPDLPHWPTKKNVGESPDHERNLMVQGPRFLAAAVDGATYLLAANGDQIVAASMQLQSIHVENALAEHGASAAASGAGSATNRLLNYVHSCCLRFPLDDCIGLSQASQHAQCGGSTTCRNVRLHIATGVPQKRAGLPASRQSPCLVHQFPQNSSAVPWAAVLPRPEPGRPA